MISIYLTSCYYMQVVRYFIFLALLFFPLFTSRFTPKLPLYERLWEGGGRALRIGPCLYKKYFFLLYFLVFRFQALNECFRRK